MNKEGFSAILLLIIICALLIFGFTLYQNRLSVQLVNPQTSSTPPNQIYLDKLGFSFSFPPNLKLVEDTEDAYSKRSGGNMRKNFTDTWYYNPPNVVEAISIQNPTDSSPFDAAPFSLWVFDNPKGLDPAGWYKNYWYYPFLWGEYEPRKSQEGPDQDASVSGQSARMKVVDYRADKPILIYLQRGDKMYLFRIIDGSVKVGTTILNSFKLKP